MFTHRIAIVATIAGSVFVGSQTRGADNTAPAGYVSLFNGQDFSGWKVPDGDDGHWKIIDGVIDYDAGSQSKGSKDLWSDREYGDFVLQVDWRLKEALSSTRTCLISCLTARTPRTFTARNCDSRCRTPIPACFFAVMVTIKSTSGAGRSDRARCIPREPTRKPRPSCERRHAPPPGR